MITDPRVFEDDHLPREMLHREGAVEFLRRFDRVGQLEQEVERLREQVQELE